MVSIIVADRSVKLFRQVKALFLFLFLVLVLFVVGSLETRRRCDKLHYYLLPIFPENKRTPSNSSAKTFKRGKHTSSQAHVRSHISILLLLFTPIIIYSYMPISPYHIYMYMLTRCCL